METKIKRILFVITQSEFGGAQRFLHDFITQLPPEKYNIRVAVGSDGDGTLLKILEGEGVAVQILRNLKREISVWHDFLALFELRKIIKSYAPDILFLNSSKSGFVGSLATVFPFKLKTEGNKLKTIYRIGGWTFNDPWPKWKKNFWIILEKISAKWKDIIIVNNQHDLEQAKRMKIIPREKVVLVSNGLDPYKINFLTREEARMKIFEKIAKYAGKIFQTKNLIGTIANLYPAKDLQTLILAAKHFKDDDFTAFVIIGDGPERATLEKLIYEKKLEKKIFLLGKMPDAHAYLKAFDVFVLPSVKEGFPWSVLEAMAAKVPVVATEVGAVPEIIENGKNGFIVKLQDSKMIAEKIKELLGNDRLRQEFGLQEHQTLLFKFSPDRMIKSIETLF